MVVVMSIPMTINSVDIEKKVEGCNVSGRQVNRTEVHFGYMFGG